MVLRWLKLSYSWRPVWHWASPATTASAWSPTLWLWPAAPEPRPHCRSWSDELSWKVIMGCPFQISSCSVYSSQSSGCAVTFKEVIPNTRSILSCFVWMQMAFPRGLPTMRVCHRRGNLALQTSRWRPTYCWPNTNLVWSRKVWNSWSGSASSVTIGGASGALRWDTETRNTDSDLPWRNGNRGI